METRQNINGNQEGQERSITRLKTKGKNVYHFNE